MPQLARETAGLSRAVRRATSVAIWLRRAVQLSLILFVGGSLVYNFSPYTLLAEWLATFGTLGLLVFGIGRGIYLWSKLAHFRRRMIHASHEEQAEVLLPLAEPSNPYRREFALPLVKALRLRETSELAPAAAPGRWGAEPTPAGPPGGEGVERITDTPTAGEPARGE